MRLPSLVQCVVLHPKEGSRGHSHSNMKVVHVTTFQTRYESCARHWGAGCMEEVAYTRTIGSTLWYTWYM
jgi:hypothetical protein